jgi:exopolyphosphatase/guanosine-5'-triphosphate,3'-diphosphate pyrophosphatase
VTRVAALDCGTNSIRLLVADVEPSSLKDVSRRMEIVRLGAGVDRTGLIARDALERTIGALRDYAAEIADLGAERVRMVATSATRDARNRGEFVAAVRAVLGTDPEVISGAEEAALSYAGATRDLAPAGLDPPYLVVDIGGGSTEFVRGDARGPSAARSVDIGCVRLRERRLHTDPPTPDEVEALVADVHAALDAAEREVPLRGASLVGVAGTVTTVAGMALGLPAYDAERIHLTRVPAADVERIAAELTAMPRAARAAVPVMHPGRVDVIASGALVLREIVRRAGAAEVVASEHDILDGIAYSLAQAS